MSEAQIASSLGIIFLAALTTHVFYRRPPAALWPALPTVFFSALIFSIGDLLSNVWADNLPVRWIGMLLVYTGLLTIAPGWWLFTRGFSEMMGYRKIAFRSGLPLLLTINALLWVGLLTNPWHGQFLETHASARSEYGPLWYATAIINYFALMAAMFVHAKEGFLAIDPTVRSQCRFLVTAVAIPMSLNMIYVFSPVAFSYDPTALGYAFSCALFLFAVERRDLFVLERVSLPSVLDADADPILIISPHQQLLYANRNAESLFGEGQLMRGAPVRELLERAVPSFAFTGLDTDRAHGIEHPFTSSTGQVGMVAIEVSVVETSRGVEAGFCLRLRDRTALREAQREAGEQLALLEALDSAMGEGILCRRADGEISYINEAFASLWGISVQQMMALGNELQPHLAKFIVELPSASIQLVWDTKRDGFSSDLRESADLSLRDGRILEVTTLPITTEQGFWGRAWRMSDVTQARRESQAMIQSQKLEGLGLLAGGIAHDFNNLLMAILGNTEIAREFSASDSPIQEPLASVESAVATAAELTSQLLAYTGKSTFTTENIDLSVMLREVTTFISANIPKNIKVEFNLAEELPSVIRGGLTQLRHVLMSLVTNASEAIGDSAGKITITTGLGRPMPMAGSSSLIEHGEKINECVYISVCDDGVGIDAATLEKIFDPFFSTKFPGRGLGLAATRGIVESHQGRLLIETKPTLGSTFTLFLPIQAESPPVEAANIDAHTAEGFANRGVLVVDDEALLRRVLGTILSAAGFKVFTASDGSEALATVEEMGTAINLVILDITMPGLSGIETRMQIRQHSPALPIIMSSGHPEETLDRLEGWSPDRDGFIQKPYRNQALLAAIESLLFTNRT
jgi:signal transduction histidine kinase